MPLSLRLKLIASLVPDGARVCDIGTDHAYLPIELIKSGKAISVIATDIREKPLENARKISARSNLKYSEQYKTKRSQWASLFLCRERQRGTAPIKER